MFLLLLRVIIAAAWVLNIFCLFFFLYNSYKKSKNIKTVIAVLCLIASGMIYMESGIIPRDGHDEQIVMELLTVDTCVAPKLKEMSLAFSSNIISVLSNNNLKAILMFNRTLPFISMFLLFVSLRNLRLSSVSSIAASALLFLNFNMMISASSMAFTSQIIFIFLCSLSSTVFIFRYFQSDRKKLRLGLLYFFAALVLIITSRAELAPIPVLLLLTLFYLTYRDGKFNLHSLKIIDLAILISGISICAVCSIEVLNRLSTETMAHGFEPYRNILYHLIAYNFSVLLDSKLYIASEKEMYMGTNIQLLFVILSAFIATGLHGFIRQKKTVNTEKIILVSVFCILFLYIVNMYATRDHYYLQFVRHNVVCLTIFAFIFSFTIEGYKNIFSRHRKNFIFLCSLLMFFYFSLNAQTAFSLNKEQRTNDKLWNLLLKTQKQIKGRYNIIAPYTDYQPFMKKFFNVHSETIPLKTIYFISPELYAENIIHDDLIARSQHIFTDSDIYKGYDYRPIPQIPVSFGFFILKDNYEMEKYFINFKKDKINVFINELQKDITEKQDNKLKISYLILALAAAGQENKAKQILNKYEKLFSGYGKDYRIDSSYIYSIHIPMNNMLFAIENITADRNKFIYEMIKNREFGRPEYLLDFIISVYRFPLQPYENFHMK